MSFLETVLASLFSSGAVIAAAAYIFKVAFEKRMEQEVESFKAALGERLAELESRLRIGEAREDVRFRQLLEFRAEQLSEFYWPLYIGLQKDNVVWRRILDKRDGTDELKKRVGTVVERDVVLPNHERLVTLIEKHIHLAEADEELEWLLLVYIRHVAIYKAIRTAGEENVFPISAGEEFPHGLFPAVERRVRELQEDYNRLLNAQERAVREVGMPVARDRDDSIQDSRDVEVELNPTLPHIISSAVESPPQNDVLDDTAKAILNYLSKHGFTMASFERLRDRLGLDMPDLEFESLIARHPAVFRKTFLKDGKPGIVKRTR